MERNKFTLMNFAKVDSSSFDDLKRLFVKFLRYGKSDVQEHCEASPYGVDSRPIKDVIAVVGDMGDNGKKTIVGYLNVERKADTGEIRIFSTDDNAVEKFYIWLKKNGTCEIGGDQDNAVRYSKLEQAFNELKTDFNSFVAVFNTHTHSFVGTGTVGTPQSSGQSSNADISPAKINEIKVP